MKEALRYKKEQQKSKRLKLDKKDKRKNESKAVDDKEVEKLTKGKKIRNKRNIKEEIKIWERELKVIKIRDKKDELIKKVNAQNDKDEIKEKLEGIFKERKPMKKKERSWMKLKCEIENVGDTTDQIYNAVLGLILERERL